MFSWTQTQWQALHVRVQQRQLPHALLLTGPHGVGKLQFASEFAQSLLCETPDPQARPCGRCRSCTQFQAQTHPDYHLIIPETDSKAIKIDQIRQLREDLSLSSHHAGFRPVIICPAEAMNSAAANSLLKTLEEPPAQTILLLISHQPSLLAATIRSRCQRLPIGLPTAEHARAWLMAQLGGGAPTGSVVDEALALNQGAPLPAYSWITSGRADTYHQAFAGFCDLGLGSATALDVAAKWLKADPGVPIHWLYHWVGDLVRLKSGHFPQDQDAKAMGLLQKLAQQVDLTGLYDLLTEVTDALRRQGTAINQQLTYESILLRWADLARRDSPR